MVKHQCVTEQQMMGLETVDLRDLLRLLLDSRVVDVPMASNPTFVMLSFFNVENSVMLCRLCKYILFQWSFIIVAT